MFRNRKRQNSAVLAKKMCICAYLFAQRCSEITRTAREIILSTVKNCSEAATHKENRLGVTGSLAEQVCMQASTHGHLCGFSAKDRRNLLFSPFWPALYAARQSVCLLMWPPFEQKLSVSSSSTNKMVQSTGKWASILSRYADGWGNNERSRHPRNQK